MDLRAESDYSGPSDALKTYRYLRLGIIAAVVLLGASLVLEIGRSDRWLGSISAYYYTPTRSVFVGSMMMIGLSLIVIKGHGKEDLLLNVAGMLAPVVALVPTQASTECEVRYPTPGPCDGRDILRAPTNIANNMRSLVFVGALCFAGALAIALLNTVRSKHKGGAQMEGVEPGTWRSLLVAFGLLVAGLFWYSVMRTRFDRYAHLTAAILMFIALFAAVLSKVLEHRNHRPVYARWYSTVAFSMVVGALLFMGSRISHEHHVFILEAWEIGSFAGFWVVQTFENWWNEPVPEAWHP